MGHWIDDSEVLHVAPYAYPFPPLKQSNNILLQHGPCGVMTPFGVMTPSSPMPVVAIPAALPAFATSTN